MKKWREEILAVNREDAKETVKQFQFAWIRDILLQTGMNLEGCFPEDEEDDITLEQKILLKNILNENKILVIDDRDGGIKIYVEKELIAEWIKPSFTLHQDLSQLDPKKKLYTCIHIKYWSVFDAEEFVENE